MAANITIFVWIGVACACFMDLFWDFWLFACAWRLVVSAFIDVEVVSLCLRGLSPGARRGLCSEKWCF